MTGQGGNGSDRWNIGIAMLSNALVESTGAGPDAATITMMGTGGDGGTDSAWGVEIQNSQVASTDGNIDITGVGGNGSSFGNRGIKIFNSGSVTSSGTGSDAATISLTVSSLTAPNLSSVLGDTFNKDIFISLE